MPGFNRSHSFLGRGPARATALLLGLGLGLGLGPIPQVLAAPAEDEAPAEADTEAKAMKAYNDGKAAYDSGDYKEALELFLDAQSLYPSPVFHYNIGLCQEALSNWEQAITSYEAYLRSYENVFGEPPEDTVNTQNKIARAKDALAAEEQAANQPAEPQVIVQAPPADDEDKKAPAKPGRGLIIAGAVLTGVGIGVAAGGGAVFGIQASGFAAELDAVYTGGNPERVTLDQARAIDEDGRAAGLNQVLMISIGSAVGVTGVALLVTGLIKKNKATKAAKAAKVDVAPTMGANGAGLLIRGRF